MGGQNPIFFIGFHRRTRATAYRSPLGLSLLYSGGPAANFEGWPGLSTQDGTSGDSQRQGTRAPPTGLSLPQNADGSRSRIVRACPSRDSIAGRHRGRMRPSRIDLHPLLGTGHCRQRTHSCPDRSQQRVRRVRAGYRANATIGRALRLLTIDAGRGPPGRDLDVHVRSSRALQGCHR
jgi:hypothetical protein